MVNKWEISEVDIGDEGKYTCLVQNSAGASYDYVNVSVTCKYLFDHTIVIIF